MMRGRFMGTHLARAASGGPAPGCALRLAMLCHPQNFFFHRSFRPRSVIMTNAIHRRRRTWVLALWGALTSSLAVAQSAVPETAAEVDAVIRAFVAERQVTGLSAALSFEDELLHVKGYGKADLENDVAVPPETVF